MAKQPEITIKVTFDDGHEMLFGNSYKTWDHQLEEYCGRFNAMPFAVSATTFPWIGYGGLKWSPPGPEFQEQLDDEGKGRKADDIKWGPLPKCHHKAWGNVVRDASMRRARQMQIAAAVNAQ